MKIKPQKRLISLQLLNRVLFCVLFLQCLINTPVLSQLGPSEQARKDTQSLNEIASNNKCSEQAFHANLKLRNEIAIRSQNYLSEFDFLQNAFMAADRTLLTCSQYIIKVNKDSKQNDQHLEPSLNKMTQAYNDCIASITIVAQQKKEAVKVLVITATVGGISILILIILVIKIKSAKELLIEEGKKIFDDTIDALREKLFDVAFAKWDDKKWKKKFKELQSLYEKYRRREIPVIEFKRQLDKLLTA